MQLRSALLNIFIGITACTAIGLALYPTVANTINQLDQNSSIVTYNKVIQNTDTTELDEMYGQAQEYNENFANGQSLFSLSEEEKEEYDSLLNATGDGVMASIEIPKQNIRLQIYHGTSDEVLEKAVGHLEGTSLPVEGKSVHSVITGHTGLPNLDLFTDIKEMELGDTFSITVLNRKLTYTVDQIDTVLPEELYNLQIENGKNYCTLVTCTPYGVNDHRLLVRGTLTKTEIVNSTVESVQSSAITITSSDSLITLIQMGCIAVAILGGLVVVFFIIRYLKNR